MCTDVSEVPVAFINRISCTSAGTNLNSDVHNGGCAYVNGFKVLVPLCADDADIGAGYKGAEFWTS